MPPPPSPQMQVQWVIVTHLQPQNASSEVAIVQNRWPAVALLVTKEGIIPEVGKQSFAVSCERAVPWIPPTLFLERGLKFTLTLLLWNSKHFSTKGLFCGPRWEQRCLFHPKQNWLSWHWRINIGNENRREGGEREWRMREVGGQIGFSSFPEYVTSLNWRIWCFGNCSPCLFSEPCQCHLHPYWCSFQVFSFSGAQDSSIPP